MKKILIVAVIASSLMACNDSKTTDPGTDKKDTVIVNTTPETPVTTPDVTVTTETPKFEDADVQKLADEYAVFVKEAAASAGDATRTAEYTKKAQDWAMKMTPVMQKLASKPEELKKWSDYMQKLAMEMTPPAK